jgi:hypothetical protein
METVLLILSSSSGHWSKKPTRRIPKSHKIWLHRSSTPLLSNGITPDSTKGNKLDLQLSRREGRPPLPLPLRPPEPPEEKGRRAGAAKETFRREGWGGEEEREIKAHNNHK